MFNFLTSNYGDFRSDNFAIPRCLLLHCARAAAWCWLVHNVVELETKVHPKVRDHGEGPY